MLKILRKIKRVYKGNHAKEQTLFGFSLNYNDDDDVDDDGVMMEVIMVVVMMRIMKIDHHLLFSWVSLKNGISFILTNALSSDGEEMDGEREEGWHKCSAYTLCHLLQ